ncbi:MAG TPA: D-alanine--D-alanine ligase family protein [Solirubrobacteraceae bacterium]|nr:D-alanine--D-alanine ligase family protein [Solirubrobacteraceae bacterium]
MSGRALRVAVLAGGRSAEREVSLASGETVRDGLLASGHDVVWVEIGADGAWHCDGEAVRMTPGAGLLGADVVFPALHGPYGEDGTVQGLLETLDVAYVGSGVAASALCVDKVLFKQLMSGMGVPQVDYVGVHEGRFRNREKEVLGEIARLGLPVFVKPAHLGSSVGIVKVGASENMRDALEQAFAHDELAIVEAVAGGVEIECGVLGAGRGQGAGGAPPLASEPGEIVFEGDWYDFDAKYAPGGMRLQVPAPIPRAAAEAVRTLSARVFLHAGCHGLARVDCFVDGEQVLLNELNTMPGFTRTSVYATLMQASGVAYPELVDRLCRLALERHGARNAYRH